MTVTGGQSVNSGPAENFRQLVADRDKRDYRGTRGPDREMATRSDRALVIVGDE
ncbi:hypothetical protein [Rhodococcus sp. IEGM 1379]|uniref:hypothetical protein n=1 Tax=Rhodococcus sp. IEGM 1379 TaxID=3047086 RepID=UPI0024B80439|nr:hypothetical protein [Rhodococcus sp. IEGM 1379]MDI9915921.1 hypothetical protein [Rhodococcus sp. IEGM 1379]